MKNLELSPLKFKLGSRIRNPIENGVKKSGINIVTYST